MRRDGGKLQLQPSDRPAVAVPAAPVQLPIAQSLMQTGQVQLYVHFATDSNQLYEDSLPLLNELLAALRANRA